MSTFSPSILTLARHPNKLRWPKLGFLPVQVHRVSYFQAFEEGMVQDIVACTDCVPPKFAPYSCTSTCL